MALGEWAKLDPAAIRGAIDQVRRGKAGAEALLAGLLGVIYRFSEDDNFPADLKEPVEEVVLGFEYAREPEVESQAILLYTCEILAGQRYPERSFIASAKEGRQHRERGERLALEWLRERGQRGFEEWNSSCAFEWEFLALSHLASLAASDPVRELAAVLMDKMLFLIAVNSYQGALGSTHGQARASTIKSAKLEATSGITRMLWGLGVYNAHILGMVSLACSDYEYPSFYAELASQLPEEMWSRERHVFDGSEANLAAYKTQDYMLSSAQDYRPGQKGRSEHIWQATMGPDAVVFANHPAWMSESEAHQPGFWLGNAILPRVAQWKDILIAVHNLPEGDWMGFTHAYFPIYAFDEWELDGGWAFARKGKGYLAITAKAGIELIKRGPDGYRELRSYGRENIWLCHMGRDDVDGYFRSFKKDILKMRPEWGPLSVRFNSLRKEKLSFGWEGPLLVDGNEQPITGFKHIDNPYCTVDLPAKQMDIAYGEVVLRLNFD
jgi:hypothetical protein